MMPIIVAIKAKQKRTNRETPTSIIAKSRNIMVKNKILSFEIK